MNSSDSDSLHPFFHHVAAIPDPPIAPTQKHHKDSTQQR